MTLNLFDEDQKLILPTVGTDIDDCLVLFAEDIINFHNDNYGTNNTLEQVVNFDLWKLWGCSKDEFHNRLSQFTKEFGCTNIPKPMPYATQAIDDLSEKLSFVKITARQSKLYPITLQTLETLFHPLFSRNLCFTYEMDTNPLFTRKKSDLCLLYGVKTHIEDSPKHALECAHKGIHVLLMDQPWNQIKYNPDLDHKNITRVNDWREISGILCDIYKI